MKTILYLSFLLLVNCSFSQEISAKLSNALPNEHTHSYQSFFHKGKVYFFDNDRLYKERAIVVDTENDQVLDLEQKKLTIDDYVVSLVNNKKHIDGEYLYELAYCSNKKKLVNFGYAILKRNLNSISEVEAVVWLENFDVSPGYSSVINTYLYPGKSCFYIIRKAMVGKSGEQNYIAKYNYDLEEIWKKDFSFTNETGIDVDYVNVNENDDLLICLKIKGGTKGGWFKSVVVQSGLFFYVIKNNGEELSISPQINQNVVINKYDLRYYPEKEEVVGLFVVNKLYEKDYTSYDNGFAYMKWDNEGSLLTSNVHYFTLEELRNPVLDQYLAAKKQDYKKYLNKKGDMNTISTYDYNAHFTDNQEVVVGHGGNKKIFYRIDHDGQLEWINFSEGEMTEKFVVKDNVIYLCGLDYAENFVSGQYKVSPKTKKPILSAIKIDAKTGELLEIQPIINVPSADYLLYHRRLLVDERNLSFVVECRNMKKKSRKLVSFSW